MQSMNGLVAIVTGGGQGLGLGVARKLAGYGVKLVITGRVQEKLEGVAAMLRANGAAVEVVAGDVGERATADKVVAAALASFGRLDILVNNAQTIYPQTPLIDHTDEIILGSIGSGLLGTIYFMQAAYLSLKEQRGAVLNVGSLNGTQGIAGSAAYAAAKEGIRAVTRVAAREWGCDGIRVNVMCPGAMTGPVKEYFERQPELEAVFRSQLSLGRFATPEDVGELAAFLVSPTCFITGQTIHIDGGQIMP